jgi:hypothetical protein
MGDEPGYLCPCGLVLKPFPRRGSEGAMGHESHPAEGGRNAPLGPSCGLVTGHPSKDCRFRQY